MTGQWKRSQHYRGSSLPPKPPHRFAPQFWFLMGSGFTLAAEELLRLTLN